ncbi:hypothetical protein UFOVP207_1 [uncultured Caudovirales phage]|uniref:Uncharacterized protein n=1 Tax=uncultured Caudovirales phage TaxID=2100421 RepID=A0A6J7WIT4_9CAUD|nr:hypothetical protein UFOVP207_1 [uncultured Caudovirales phage]
MEKETLLKKVKNFLVELTGVELESVDTKLEDQVLADGQTTIQADIFEAGQNVFIVVPDAEPVPLPVGEYELADGKILVVKEDGLIDSIVEAMPTEENSAEAKTEVPVEAEKTPEQAKVKKIVRSQVEEQHFSEVEELKAKIVELESKVIELSKVEEEQPTDVIEFTAEPKPIQFNPENSTSVELVELTPGKAKGIRDSILETIYS